MQLLTGIFWISSLGSHLGKKNLEPDPLSPVPHGLHCWLFLCLRRKKKIDSRFVSSFENCFQAWVWLLFLKLCFSIIEDFWLDSSGFILKHSINIGRTQTKQMFYISPRWRQTLFMLNGSSAPPVELVLNKQEKWRHPQFEFNSWWLH